MSVAEILSEIPKLSFEEREQVAHAMGVELDAWDLQMIEDSKPGGKLDRMFKEAEAAYRRGECEELA